MWKPTQGGKLHIKLSYRAAKLVDYSRIQCQKQQQKKNCKDVRKTEISRATKMLHVDSSTEVDGINLLV